MLDDCYQDGISGFRPLTGICFSQSIYRQAIEVAGHVSVPLRGYVFLNKVLADYYDLDTLFPSPYGDMFFSIRKLFPSVVTYGVSVPLRGYVFLNLNFSMTMKKEIGTVSVPLRGYVFLNIQSKRYWKKLKMFPSPYGDMFFSILCLQTTGSKGLQRRSAALTAAGFFLNLCASLVTLFFQPFPLQNTSFSLNSQIFQTSVENGCTSMVQAPISYSSPRYFAHFTVWGETPRRRS